MSFFLQYVMGQDLQLQQSETWLNWIEVRIVVNEWWFYLQNCQTQYWFHKLLFLDQTSFIRWFICFFWQLIRLGEWDLFSSLIRWYFGEYRVLRFCHRWRKVDWPWVVEDEQFYRVIKLKWYEQNYNLIKCRSIIINMLKNKHFNLFSLNQCFMQQVSNTFLTYYSRINHIFVLATYIQALYTFT